MKVRLANGRAARARARAASGIPIMSSGPLPFPKAWTDPPESDPESWPRFIVYRDDEDGSLHVVDVECRITVDPESWPIYVLDRDNEDGSLHIVDLDTSVEWDGWRISELEEVEGGEL
jgi:hypothetical protein